MGNKDPFHRQGSVSHERQESNVHTPAEEDADTAFWQLPPIQKKTYRQPSFSGRTTDTVPLTQDTPHRERQEKIPPKQAGTASLPAQPVRAADIGQLHSIRTSSYATAKEYANKLSAASAARTDANKQYGFSSAEFGEMDPTSWQISPKHHSAGEIMVDRMGDGWLIRQVTVRCWINDFSFYSNFARDARISHKKVASPAEAVPYASYVPQYAHMDSHQLAFYLWFRDNARISNYLEADFAYILLYIFEILNLPDCILPEEGIRLLCHLWQHYRKLYPRLDVYLCEWIPDYAMIHNVVLPDTIDGFLPEIVRRAQFKEFYLDHMRSAEGTLSPLRLQILAEVLIEAYSDYDYKKSRYYNTANKEQYDTCILEALTAVLTDAYQNHRGIFALDRTYRLTRDSFSGAIIETSEKRRIDVAFNSCIRSPDTRRFVTGIVKYAENKLRFRLRIKSKLGTDSISPQDRLLVDTYFGPDLPPTRKNTGISAEEEKYLKLYEADQKGFDFSSAYQIEEASWINTARLTVSDTNANEDSPTLSEDYDDEDACVLPEGALVSDTAAEEISHSAIAEDATENSDTAGSNTMEQLAVAALLQGNYLMFCRENQLFPGQEAEKINEIFLTLVGDILIEVDNNQYNLIEEYREDAAQWSKTNN